MSLRNRLALPAIILSLTFLAGCGSSSPKAVAPPGGGFTYADLSGTYVFSAAGSDPSNSFIAIAGTFTACGCSQGTISGGTIEANDPSAGVLSPQAVTGGTYSVGVDGRPASASGVLTLQTAAGPFVFDFVLTSSQHGLLTLFDPNNGSGSGTLDLATSVAQTSIDGQSFAFNASGVTTASGSQAFFGTIGGFTLDANGAIGISTTGSQDINDGGISLCSATTGCQITGGSVNVGTVPGTATFTSSASTIYNFHVYPISATHWKIIETDVSPVTVGDVFTQSTSIPTGNNVFTIAGFDSSASGPFVAAGIIDTDGSGGIKSDSVEDVNDAGVASEIGSVVGSTITGNYTALTGGRSLFTFTSNFVNSGLGCANCEFAAYPSTGGLQLLEVDNAGVTAGVAYLQGSNPALASSTGYGMNLAGINTVEEDDIAEFVNNAGTFTGLIDFNDAGSRNFGVKFSGSYAADSTVTGRGTVTPGSNSFHMTTYGIDATTTVFVETDSNQVGLGSFESQGSNTPGAALRQMTVMRLLPSAKKAVRKR